MKAKSRYYDATFTLFMIEWFFFYRASEELYKLFLLIAIINKNGKFFCTKVIESQHFQVNLPNRQN